MVRIYFDKQIFSHLFKGEKERYVELLNKIRKNTTNLYCYSHAHLLDLKNDTSDIKYKELEFMETIVNDNYLSYHALDKNTSCYLVTPPIAFEDVEEEIKPNFNDLLDFDYDIFTPQQQAQIELAKDTFYNRKFDLDFINEGTPKELKPITEKLFPEKLSSMSMNDWVKNFMGMLNTIQEDKSIYKGLRNLTDSHFNNEKFTVNYDEIDFNEDLKNSSLGKTFIEYVNNSINPTGKNKVSNYDFYVNAYFSLDILGISKEPSKKVKFNNVLYDALHSYYGAYCDCVVSDDQGFCKKTRVLYKLLGIETKIMVADEFIQSFNFIIPKREEDQGTFSDLLLNDLKNAIVLKTYSSLDIDRHTVKFKPSHNYLGYFNRFDRIIEEGKVFLYFYRATKNYSYFTFLREYELVVNNAVEVFGLDQSLKGKFDWESEKELLDRNKWEGRLWDFDDFTFKIEHNNGSNKLSILISFRNLGTGKNNDSSKINGIAEKL